MENSTNTTTNTTDLLNTTAAVTGRSTSPPPVVYELYIIPLLVVVLGLVGNILSICVLNRGRLSHISISVYLKWLAVTDIFTLCTLAIDNIQDIVGSRPYYHYSWACKLYVWLKLTLPWTSSWILVANTIERAIAVTLPHKAKQLCTVSKAKITTGVIYILFPLLNFHVFFMYDIVDDSCQPISHVYIMTVGGIAVAMYSLLPSIIIVTCNVIIVTTLSRRQKLYGNISVSTSPNTSCLFRMLIISGFFFMVFTLPFNVLNLLDFAGVLPQTGMKVLVMTVCFELCMAHHAANFVLYVLSGSLFRSELLRMCRCGTQGSESDSGSTASGTRVTESECERF